MTARTLGFLMAVTLFTGVAAVLAVEVVLTVTAGLYAHAICAAFLSYGCTLAATGFGLLALENAVNTEKNRGESPELG